MALLTNLKKFIYNYTTDSYNPLTEKGYWQSKTEDGIPVWYMEIPSSLHSIQEPICNVYRLESGTQYKQYDPYKITVNNDDIIVFIRQDTSPNKLEGKVIIL